jgi:sugar phosphate isomerase/epimerase
MAQCAIADPVGSILRIEAQVHIQEMRPHPPGPRGRVILSETGMPLPAIADALCDIGYRGWLVVEASMPSGRAEGFRQNVEFIRQSFAGKAPK